MLYTAGFILVLIYVLMGIDDLVWDILYFFVSKKKKHQPIDLKDLDKEPPRLMAIVVAAWHEDGVLGDVIDNLILSMHYPRSMYHVFLGVYPNDDATIAVAQKLSEKHDNVHVVINGLPGPTCKADNVNNVLRNIQKYEKMQSWKFAGIVLHDAEDVVHPYELKLENHILKEHDAVQLPVFPLQQMPRPKNIFTHMTSGTYADEFAENHFRNMVARDILGGFVPSAGTGFAISREVLDYFGEEDVFSVGSLTEDYKLSLYLKEHGFNLHYVLESINRINDEGKTVKEFVATRSLFPNDFHAAVKQKTRWIYGITIQSFGLREVLKKNTLDFVSKFSLYKDWKAKIGNLLTIPGYAVLIYFIISLFIELPLIYPKYSPSWWISVCLTILMVERQILRSVAINAVYGFKSALISCCFPPLIPIRTVWGNIINFSATIGAWRQLFFGASKRKNQKWNKTDHEFLPKSVLVRYHRKLGDELLIKNLVEAPALANMLQHSKNTKKRLGSILIEKKMLEADDLYKTLAEVLHMQYFSSLSNLINPKYASYFDQCLLENHKIFPLLKLPSGWVIAAEEEIDENIISLLKTKTYSQDIYIVLSTLEEINSAIDQLYTLKNDNKTILSAEKQLTNSKQVEQVIIALKYLNEIQQYIDIPSLLEYMGIMKGNHYNKAAQLPAMKYLSFPNTTPA